MTNSMNNKVFIVTRLYISASDYNSNGYYDCEVFLDKEKALQLFKKWRKEELDIRRETECTYEIYTDTEEKFHCSWDIDLEMLIIKMQEKTIISD